MARQTPLLLISDDQHRSDLAERNRWMIRVRWFYVILLPAIATIATIALGREKQYIKLYMVMALAGLSLNTVIWLFGRVRGASMAYYRTLAFVQVVIDLLLASVVIYAQGGITSRATLLYAIPIVGAGSLFLHPAAYIAAVLSGIAYAGSLYGSALQRPDTINMGDVWVPAIFYPSMFLLLAALITRFSAINSRNEQENAYRELLGRLHEKLQQPTTAIAAAVEKLEASKGYLDWTIEDKEYLSEVVGENARLHAMIANVLESADEQETASDNQAASADLVVLLRDAANHCALSAGRKSDLLFGAPNIRVPVYGQPQQLKRAFENIIDNAFRYSQRKTQVNVILEYNDELGHITVTIKDKGRGMSEEDQKELFQMFTRLEEQAVAEGSEENSSLGLGLYVSKVILERHHGKLEMNSEPDKGTTVTVRIQEELWRRKNGTA